MCGIAGFLLRRAEAAQENQLAFMGAALQHRGPDHFGVFVHENLGLAHNRLSIVDLSVAANQPFKNDRHALVFNGEIYNHIDLRKRLSEKGAVFTSHSDTETLFLYLIHFGVDETLRQIKGMFAFVFCDLEKKNVYLCRDRFGIKPLMWTENEKGVYWASEVKALKALLPIRLDPLKALFSAASTGDQSSRNTVFAGVQQVPPGTYLLCKDGKVHCEIRYYNPLDEVKADYYTELNGLSLSEVVGTLDDLLSKSVKKMLMSDVPMGSFVSGGVDSSLIASLASRYDPQHQLFTANVIGKYSEYEDAQSLSRIIGRKLQTAEFRPQDMLKKWAQCTHHYECPIVTHTNAVPFSEVALLARQSGVKAVLTGEGSDELFWGYPHLHWGGIRSALRLPLEVSRKIYGLVPGLANRIYDEQNSIQYFLYQSVRGFEAERLKQEALAKYAFLGPQESARHCRTVQMMNEGLLSLLHRNDRMGMQFSIESRFPFLDEDVVRFAVNLPGRFKGGFTPTIFDTKHPFIMDKKVVRAAALKYLPRRLAFKRKEGFPMYGHRHLKVKSGYFSGGYVADVLKLSQDAEKYMCESGPSYYLAKLISVDLFGRIFEGGESIDAVTQNLLKGVTLET